VSKKTLRILTAIAAAAALTFSVLSPAGADHNENHDPPGQGGGGGNGGGGNGGGGNGGGGDGGGGNQPQTCPGEHLDPDDYVDTLILPTVPGDYISEICVKAGSVNQGDDCGPVYLSFDPGVPSLTLDEIRAICDGRTISHFSITSEGPPTCAEDDTLPGCGEPECTANCGEEECETNCGESDNTTTTTTKPPDDEPEPTTDPSGVLGAGAANAQVGAPSFTG